MPYTPIHIPSYPRRTSSLPDPSALGLSDERGQDQEEISSTRARASSVPYTPFTPFTTGITFDPPLTFSHSDRDKWHTLHCNLLWEFDCDDFVDLTLPDRVQFNVGERPALPKDGTGFVVFKSRCDGMDGAVMEKCVRRVWKHAVHVFGKRVWRWGERAVERGGQVVEQCEGWQGGLEETSWTSGQFGQYVEDEEDEEDEEDGRGDGNADGEKNDAAAGRDGADAAGQDWEDDDSCC